MSWRLEVESQDKVTQGAVLAAFAQYPTPSGAGPLFASMGEWAAWNTATLAAVGAPGRPGWWRRVWRVVVALARLTARRLPRWVLPIAAVMAVIPLDPFDELPLLPIVVWVAVRHRAEFTAVARDAWRAS